MMKVISGDLFQLYPRDRNVVIAHCCNNLRKWGAGFVLPLGNRFPQAKANYIGLSEERMRLGTCQLVRVEPKVVIANMIAQDGLIGPANPHPLQYDALEQTMVFAHTNVPEDFEFHCPMFGAGLAGGSWEKISELIEKVWATRTVTIYSLVSKAR